MSNYKNWNKKCTLFASGLLCALCFRIPISTAAFCVTRFCLDPSLLGIYISRMLNGIMMSWQLGQWTAISVLGLTGSFSGMDLNASDGEANHAVHRLKINLQSKIRLNLAANWLVLVCFCPALFFFCHSEEGHLTGFYWSMLGANFCWKWSEAFGTNISELETNWYIVTFSLSAIYIAALKVVLLGCVKYCCVRLADANVRLMVVGTRSIKTSVDYIVSTFMILITVILSVFIFIVWTPMVVKTRKEPGGLDVSPYHEHVMDDDIWRTVKEDYSDAVLTQLQKRANTIAVTSSNNQLADAIHKAGIVDVRGHSNGQWTNVRNKLDLTKATVTREGLWVDDKNNIVIELNGLNDTGEAKWNVKNIGGNDRIIRELQKLFSKKLVTRKVSVKLVNVYKAGVVRGKSQWHVQFNLEETTHNAPALEELKLAVNKLKDADETDNELVTAIKKMGASKIDTMGGETLELNFTNATINPVDAVNNSPNNQITIRVGAVKCMTRSTGRQSINADEKNTLQTAKDLKRQLDQLIPDKIADLKLTEFNVMKLGSPVNITINIAPKTPQELDAVLKELKNAANKVAVTSSNNQLAASLKSLGGSQKVDTTSRGCQATLNFSSAQVNIRDLTLDNNRNRITIAVNNLTSLGSSDSWWSINTGNHTSQTVKTITKHLDNLIGTGKIRTLNLTGQVWLGNSSGEIMLGERTGDVKDLKIGVTVNNTARDWVTGELNLKKSDLQASISAATRKSVAIKNVASAAQPNEIEISLDKKVILDVTNAATLKTDIEDKIDTVKGLIAHVDSSREVSKITITVKDTENMKRIDYELGNVINWGPAAGLGGGTIAGALLGFSIGSLIVSANHNKKARRLSGLRGGSLVGGLVGIIAVEIYQLMDGSKNEEWTVWCSMFLAVMGHGTIYAVYPGMAPCSITDFSYFNIIDSSTLILSAIPACVIVGLSFAQSSINPGGKGTQGNNNLSFRIWYCVLGTLFLVVQNVCQIISICVLQNPNTKVTQKITSSPWIAGCLTATIQIGEYIATAVGFGGASGWSLNGRVVPMQHTLTLLVGGITGIIGEGYLTELKKYEPGMWPTRFMGKCEGFRWLLGRVYANAWQILMSIFTTDLRRHLMLFEN